MNKTKFRVWPKMKFLLFVIIVAFILVTLMGSGINFDQVWNDTKNDFINGINKIRDIKISL